MRMGGCCSDPIFIALVFSQFILRPILAPNVSILFVISCIPASVWLMAEMSSAKSRSANLFWPHSIPTLASSIALVMIKSTTDNATESMHQLTDDKDTYCKRNLTIPVLDHLLISDEHFGTHQLLATTYLYLVPAVINKEQSLKKYRNL